VRTKLTKLTKSGSGPHFRRDGTIFGLLATSRRTSRRHPASGVLVIMDPGVGLSGGLVFPKLSKLLNQEDA